MGTNSRNAKERRTNECFYGFEDLERRRDRKRVTQRERETRCETFLRSSSRAGNESHIDAPEIVVRFDRKSTRGGTSGTTIDHRPVSGKAATQQCHTNTTARGLPKTPREGRFFSPRTLPWHDDRRTAVVGTQQRESCHRGQQKLVPARHTDSNNNSSVIIIIIRKQHRLPRWHVCVCVCV